MDARDEIERRARPGLAPAGETLSILTWNLGYAGLGAGSDFVVDGGKHYFPPSRRAVLENAAGIADVLRAQNDDVVLLQEIAGAGPPNFWVDLRARVEAALAETDQSFFADFRSRFLPWPLRARHGLGVYARHAVDGTDVVRLPDEATRIFGVERRYAALIARLGAWSIASVHFAAFDKDAVTRLQQLHALMEWAQREFARGQRVVIGGDFNLQLAPTHFPYTTAQHFLFWLFPFPSEALPEGWSIACASTTPSVRSNERAYRVGENYTTVIDGFVVSPNVKVEEARGIDLGFAHSDHNPVRVRLSALA